MEDEAGFWSSFSGKSSGMGQQTKDLISTQKPTNGQRIEPYENARPARVSIAGFQHSQNWLLLIQGTHGLCKIFVRGTAQANFP
jgi:hypothetical protein